MFLCRKDSNDSEFSLEDNSFNNKSCDSLNNAISEKAPCEKVKIIRAFAAVPEHKGKETQGAVIFFNKLFSSSRIKKNPKEKKTTHENDILPVNFIGFKDKFHISLHLVKIVCLTPL